MIKNYKGLITGLALAINGLIILSIFLPHKEQFKSYSLAFLPLLNAIMNGMTFVFLLLAFWSIKQKEIKLHRNMIWGAFLCTSIFLVSYLLYHFTTPSTHFGGQGWVRSLYYFLLITHIILAVIVVPLALVSMGRGLNGQVELHKKITRWSMPIWLYVSSSGVIVYLLISPYYT